MRFASKAEQLPQKGDPMFEYETNKHLYVETRRGLYVLALVLGVLTAYCHFTLGGDIWLARLAWYPTVPVVFLALCAFIDARIEAHRRQGRKTIWLNGQRFFYRKIDN